MNETLEKFNEKINKHLLPNWDLQTNQYGAKYDAGFEDEIIKFKKSKLLKEIPRILYFSNGINEKAEPKMITKATFAKWFDDSLTYETLAAELLKLKDQISKEKVEDELKVTTATNAISTIKNGENPLKEIHIDFFSNGVFLNKYSDADREFIFDRIRKDAEGNLYIILKDIDNTNKLFNLEIKPNTERTLLGNTTNVNTQFWPAFFRTFKNDFENWNKKILQIVQEFDFEEHDKSIEQTLIDAGIPRIYLECHKLCITMKGITTEHGLEWVYSNCSLSLNSLNSKTYNYANQVKVFSENLIQAVDITRVKQIPLFSNDENEIAIKHLKSVAANPCKEMPRLPPAWQKFLGNGRFYDPAMDLMKIACFVTNILNANYSGRQILVIGGEGEDGKGLFLNILDEIIGKEFSVNVGVQAFSQENEFGLENIINKKFIYLSDCKSVSTLFGEDKFKALTGGDAMSINRKHLRIMKWKPQGLCVAIATNRTFYVNSEHGRSRAMPLVFRKNFTRKEKLDKDEFQIMLLKEKDEFLQWCADYRYWLNHVVCKDTLLHGNTLTICTDEDMKRLAKGEDVPTEELFHNMCEKQQLGDSNFCHWNDRTDTEEEQFDEIYEILDEMFRKYCFKMDFIQADNEIWIKPLNIVSVFNDMLNDFGNSEGKSWKNKINSLGLQTPINFNSKFFTSWYNQKYNQKSMFGLFKRKMINGKTYKTLLCLTDKTLINQMERNVAKQHELETRLEQQRMEEDFELTQKAAAEKVKLEKSMKEEEDMFDHLLDNLE